MLLLVSGVLERSRGGVGDGLVFGTLLGPEATGPGGETSGTCVSGFLAAPSMHGGGSLWGTAGVWGVWYGVVV